MTINRYTKLISKLKLYFELSRPGYIKAESLYPLAQFFHKQIKLDEKGLMTNNIKIIIHTCRKEQISVKTIKHNYENIDIIYVQ